MQHRWTRLALALATVSMAALTAPMAAAQYKMTVNRDRLVNAQNEPQNWLMMNGDYGSQRYSKLTQINRDNVKNLRMVWALALGGMQDVGQNGPENEVNPLIDNGFMYTTDGWGTVYKIDARNPNKGEFVWVADPGVRHEGNVLAHARHRAVGRPGHRQSAGRPRHRDQPRLRRDRVGQAGRQGQRVRHQGALLHRADHSGRQGAGRQRRRRRRHARLAGGARRQDRQRAVALVRGAEAGRAGQRDLEGQEQRLEDRRRRHVADRLLRSGHQAHHLGHRQSGPAIRSASRGRATTSTPTRRWRSTSRPASSSGTSSTRPTTPGTTTRTASTCCTTATINGETPQGGRPFRAQRVLLHARPRQRQLHQGQPVRERPQLDQGARSQDRQAARIRSEARRAAVPCRRRARCAATA